MTANPNGGNGGDSRPDPGPPSTPPTVEASLEPVIRDLPELKRREIVTTVEREVLAIFRSGMAGPQVDPETAKILADTLQKDNENKFRYLSQKQADAAAQEKREHDLATSQHRDLMRPIVWAVIFITIVSVVAAIAFIALGHETVGTSMLTGVFGALLGYLGGLGTSGRFGRS